MSLKVTILRFIPPILYDFYRKFSGKLRTVYKGKFDSLEDIKKVLNQKELYLNKSFDLSAVNKFYAAIYNPNLYSRSTQRNGLLLELLLQLKYKNTKVNILDYGGANNPQFPNLSLETQKRNLFFIVDREELISLIKLNKKFLQLNKNIKLVNPLEFKNLKDNIDIAFFGSTVQYLEELIPILTLIKDKKCRYIVISDSVFTYDFYVKQINMYPSEFPNKWHSKNLFLKNMELIGYEILWECSNQHNYKHDTISDEDFSHHSFILERKQD